MPRESYNYLSDETRETLTDNVKAMASGWGKADRYIYQILESERGDFFPAFESMYRGALRGGLSTAAWDSKLAYLRETISGERRRQRSVIELLAEKIEKDTSTTQLLLEALRDGRIDEHERPHIRKANAAERQNCDEIDRMLDALERVN